MPSLPSTPAFTRSAGYHIAQKVALGDGGWSVRAELADGTEAYCVLSRGRRVRVAFKPSNFRGFKWYGSVRYQGKQFWGGECAKSNGVAFMLECAGLLDRKRCPWCSQRGKRSERLDGRCVSCVKVLEYQERLFYDADALPASEVVLGRSRIDGRELRDNLRCYGWSGHDDRDRFADDGGPQP